MLVSRKDREKEFKKQLITEAASRLFAHSACEAVTVEDIAREAEFGKGTIYQHFDSKESIVVHIMCQRIDELCEELEKQVLVQTDPRKALSICINLLHDYYANNSNLLIYIFAKGMQHSINEGLTELIRSKQNRRTELLVKMIEKGIKAGVIIKTNSWYLARTLEHMARGFALDDRSKERTDIDPERNLKLIKTIFADGIFVRGGGVKK
ncbi:MAG: TetR/AcrR family transcriptional regulator [Candidatus Saccharibacteria bacterium]